MHLTPHLLSLLFLIELQLSGRCAVHCNKCMQLRCAGVFEVYRIVCESRDELVTCPWCVTVHYQGPAERGIGSCS